MRRIILLFATFAFVGAASAQDQPEDVSFRAEWTERPSAQDFERLFPGEAAERGVSGVVHLCCVPRANGRLDCRVGFEWPQEYRFGQATLELAEEFRMSEESVAEYRSRPGAWLQLPVTWMISAGPREPRGLREIVDRISAGTRGLCRPQQPVPAISPAAEQ